MAFKVPTTTSPLPPISPLNPQVDFAEFSSMQNQHAFDMNNVSLSSPPTPNSVITPVGLPSSDLINSTYPMNPYSNMSQLQVV